jgi:hypothetical protein
MYSVFVIKKLQDPMGRDFCVELAEKARVMEYWEL